jgi:hypothetical protein
MTNTSNFQRAGDCLRKFDEGVTIGISDEELDI